MKTKLVLAASLLLSGCVSRAKAETLIIKSSGCVDSSNCYEKIELERKNDRFKIVSSTTGTYCDFYCHAWEWEWVYIPSFSPSGQMASSMSCGLCKTVRQIKKIECKREVIEYDEFWEDTGDPIIRPPNKSPWGEI